MNNNIRTSRGQLVESEEIVSNLLASVEHFLDIDNITEIDRTMIKQIRLIRNNLMKSYTDKNVDIKYHCIYKHLLLARMELRELLQGAISTNSYKNLLKNELQSLEKVLHYVRIKYFNIPGGELENIDCIRCVEDYMLSKREGRHINKLHKYFDERKTSNSEREGSSNGSQKGAAQKKKKAK